MNIIQLEFKNLLFSKEIKKDSKYEVIHFKNASLSKRNGVDSFVKELAKHFQIGIWSRYEKELHDELVQYVKDLGINIIFEKSLESCTYFYSIEKEEKRLKRLYNIDLTKLITLESEGPLKENYGNHFLISEFKGQEDDELIDALIALIQLENCVNTRKI